MCGCMPELTFFLNRFRLTTAWTLMTLIHEKTWRTGKFVVGLMGRESWLVCIGALVV